MSETQPPGRPYIRTPVISPDGAQIAFVYAADIWMVDARGGEAERLTAHPAGHIAPRWSPDGAQIAFTSARTGGGDIYRLPLRGGAVERVTFHDSVSTAEAWSRDGADLFFSSYRDQQSSAIYRVSCGGGTPIRWISQPYESLMHLSVSPDGRRLAFNLVRDPWWRRGPNPYGGSEIWVVSNSPDADDFQRIAADYIGMNRWPLWAPDGAGLYYVSDRSGAENLHFQPLDGGPARQVTAFREGRLLWPSISAGGQTIVFERDFSPWRLDTASQTSAPISVRVRPDSKITPVRVSTYTRDLSELALAPDGKKVAFVARGTVFADFADKETDKERRQGPSFRISSSSFREHDISWSPDSRRLAFISDRDGDGEVYLHDFASRGEVRLTNREGELPGHKHNPQFSPDGQWIAYAYSDDQIRLLDTHSGEDRAFVRANFTYGASFSWSPDSRWLVFIAQDGSFFSNLHVQEVGSDEARQITFLSNLTAYHPIWAPSGQFIVFTTGQYRAESQIAQVDLRPQPPQFREEEFERLFGEGGRRAGRGHEQPEAPAETETEGDEAPAPQHAPPAVVFEGIERRLRLLTPTQMDAVALCISPDSRDLIFLATVAGKANLWNLALDEPRADHPPRQLTGGTGAKGAAQFAPDGKSFYFLDGGQIAVRKFPSGDQSTLPVQAEVVVDFNQEKLQIFAECWRLLRDHFYDPTFRGLDWSAARTQFAPLVAGAQTSGDLITVLNLMVGELRASHLGVFPSGGGGSQDGYTGLLFDPAEQARSGRLCVADVLPDSPAALAGEDAAIRPGDELLAVNGTPAGPGANLDALLQRTVGRRVRLLVRTPRAEAPAADAGAAADGADAPSRQPEEPAEREVDVRPVSQGMYGELRYRAWVQANEQYVHRVSGGRLGYIHIRTMSYNAYQQFLVDLDSETHSKQGVVVDVRFNAGGHTATFVLDVLARRSELMSTFRGRSPADAYHLSGNRVLNKPTVLLINEGSGSNTEMFAESYRRMGLGRVVGRPTAGAVIWTFEHSLLDGTRFRLPRFKVATSEGEDLEGTGRAVDVDAALPLGATARGRDPQLDAAVATLLAQIDRVAVVLPAHADTPRPAEAAPATNSASATNDQRPTTNDQESANGDQPSEVPSQPAIAETPPSPPAEEKKKKERKKSKG